MLATAIHHPRKLWLRRALFQVHLWLGVLLSLYVAAIGLSGSLLVFQDEIRRASLPAVVEQAGVPFATADQVMAATHAKFPGQTVSFLTLPSPADPHWFVYVTDAVGKTQMLPADPYTGAPQPLPHRLFIDWVQDFHVYLLMGQTGFTINCCAGIGLLLLAITGLFLWWPGVRVWMRGLRISLRHGWKRINYDAHNAIGIWTLLIVSWWGITAVYFLAPQGVMKVVNAVSPLHGMQPPVAAKAPPTSATALAPLNGIVAQAQRLSPGHVAGISPAAKPGAAVTIYVDTRQHGDFSHRDIDTFDGVSGTLLSQWHYGQNKTLGDWFLWLMYPLHFGTLWGLGVRVLWAALGLSLPVLSITGVLMYWNRWLGKRWRALRA
ncbi:PepSY-associated TM helix domain-containing protein [Granulicella cerasi]|uniref:PepSY-associated TM helix domain-containing protein n=1 Tax=Granulicella cerasi TaxID=741063 RepID=A0ABW1ZAV6_9BACT|nr:PepSY-associated TM helix domain-containing protein [Granulicella cerasi]